jgi:hypothetical protein
MADKSETDRKAAPAAPASTVPSVTWDDSSMRSTFANVVNGASTREEVTLFFGTNQTWNLTDLKELKVRLSDRIILTPHAAKRLWVLLGGILQNYERRFGPLDIDAPQR